ncbi:MAG: patatin family protein [Atopobiaceae bacterium]|nr:patatin family protein [Atopobiaceae bacterium]
MPRHEYSHMDQIPHGQASSNLTEGCLVLEGGAFRGLHTQGILDTLMLCGINFSCLIGVSAGALGGMNYVSGQIGRSARINIGYRHDSRYMGIKAFANSRSILDVGLLTEERGFGEPFDTDRFMQPERRFVAVATNCLTGEPTYFEKGVCANIARAVQASATMPLTAPMVWIDDAPYLDGACSCKVPYEWALQQGFKKIVVIRTRDASYRSAVRSPDLARRVYRNYPNLIRSLETIDERYNHQCDEIERLHAEGRIYRLAPSEPITIGKLEGDVEKLGDLYWLGCYDCLTCLDDMRSYLD